MISCVEFPRDEQNRHLSFKVHKELMAIVLNVQCFYCFEITKTQTTISDKGSQTLSAVISRVVSQASARNVSFPIVLWCVTHKNKPPLSMIEIRFWFSTFSMFQGLIFMYAAWCRIQFWYHLKWIKTGSRFIENNDFYSFVLCDFSRWGD